RARPLTFIVDATIVLKRAGGIEEISVRIYALFLLLRLIVWQHLDGGPSEEISVYLAILLRLESLLYTATNNRKQRSTHPTEDGCCHNNRDRLPSCGGELQRFEETAGFGGGCEPFVQVVSDQQTSKVRAGSETVVTFGLLLLLIVEEI